LAKETGYNLFTDFDAFEEEQGGPNSTDYPGIRLKEIILSPERLDIFQSAMGNSLDSNIKVIGASVLTAIGSLSSDSIYIQPVWLPDQTKHAEPKPTNRLLFVMKLRGVDTSNIGFIPMVVDESPDPDTVLQAGWTTMRASAKGDGELVLEKSQDFAVFNRANQLIMRFPAQYPSQGELVYLILEMVMNDDEIPDELVTSVHLPLGLTVSSLNKKQTTFEAIEEHQKLLKESCDPSSPNKIKVKVSKRKDPPSSDVSTPSKNTKKENQKKIVQNSSSSSSKPMATEVVDDSASDSEKTETGDT
jgi:hypothetical protein